MDVLTKQTKKTGRGSSGKRGGGLERALEENRDREKRRILRGVHRKETEPDTRASQLKRMVIKKEETKKRRTGWGRSIALRQRADSTAAENAEDFCLS